MHGTTISPKGFGGFIIKLPLGPTSSIGVAVFIATWDDSTMSASKQQMVEKKGSKHVATRL